MQYLLLSDIHSNYEALSSCLLDYALNFKPSPEVKDRIKKVLTATQRKIDSRFETALVGDNDLDKVICLGDIVGYGPQPNECVETIFNVADEITLGNHDEEVIKPEYQIIDEEKLGDVEKVWKWTFNVLTTENRNRIKRLNTNSLFRGCYCRINDIIFSHGLPVKDVNQRNQHYIANLEQFKEAFALQTSPTSIMVMGHNHYACVANGLRTEANRLVPNTLKGIVTVTDNFFELLVDFSEEERVIISVPSVGQPRDGDIKAGYAILYPDQKKVLFRKIAYDVNKNYQKIIDLGLPKLFGDWLIK